MSENSRIYGKKSDIDAAKVKHFFEARFSKENPLASVMLRAKDGDDVAEKRNRNELDRLIGMLDTTQPLRILDIGCGMGRMYENLKGYTAYYDGIDFAQNYVDTANQMFGKENVAFYQMSATDMDKGKLHPNYNTIVVNGLCVYLNDDGVTSLMKQINGLLEKGGALYFRESISVMDERLTLKDFPSTELNADYNAIYRTTAEYEQFFKDYLSNFKICSTSLMLNEETGARKETNQRYWFMTKEA